MGEGAGRRDAGEARAARAGRARAGAGEGLTPVPLDLAPLPPAVRRQIAARGREESLAEEIGALRAVLARLLATTGDDPAQLAQSVPRVVNAIVRAMQVQRLLAGESAGDLNEMVTRVLAEMGVGDE